MEASGAGLAGSGDGGGDAGAQQGEGEGGGQQFDAAAITQQLEGNTQAMEEMRQFLMSEPWQAQPEAEADQTTGDQEFDLSFLGDDTETGLDPETVAKQLAGLVDQKTQERIQPLQKQVARMQAEREAEALTAKYEELGELETAQKVADVARYKAEQIGRPDLADNMQFIEMVYLAGRAADAANAEGTEPADAAHLEGAGGAGPAGGQPVDLGDLITNGGNPNGRLGARVLDGI